MSDRAYLLLGPEKGQKTDFIANLRNSIQNEIGSDIEFTKYYAFEEKDEDLYVELTSVNLFCPHTLIVLYNVEELKATQVNNLLKYLESPSSFITLVLDSDEISLKSPASKLATKLSKTTTKFWGLQEHQLSSWVKTFFARNKINITESAIDLLLEQVDNDTLELKIICNQLAFYYQVNSINQSIDEEAIENFVHHSKNENAFTLFRYIAEGKLKESLEIAKVLLERDNTTRYTLIPGIIWSFRRLNSITEAIKYGKSTNEAFRGAKVLNRPCAVSNKRDTRTYSTAINLYSYEDCNQILSLLFKADKEIRTAGTDMTMLFMEQLIYSIIVKKGRPSLSMNSCSLSLNL